MLLAAKKEREEAKDSKGATSADDKPSQDESHDNPIGDEPTVAAGAAGAAAAPGSSSSSNTAITPRSLKHGFNEKAKEVWCHIGCLVNVLCPAGITAQLNCM